MFKEILATYLFTKLLGKKRTIKLNMWFAKYTIKTAAIIFGFVSVAHSIRFVAGVDIIIAGWAVSLWGSFVVAIITGYLSYGLWKMK